VVLRLLRFRSVVQIGYVADSLYNELVIFTNITTAGFGFMLADGDLAQARHLAFNPIQLGPISAALILTVNATGYWIVREANSFKNDLLMALAWSLPTGFDTLLAYLYVTYVAVLSVHRQRRDDHCREKSFTSAGIWNPVCRIADPGVSASAAVVELLTRSPLAFASYRIEFYVFF